MHNVFLLYMPPGNEQAMFNYGATIKERVPLSRIAPHVSADVKSRLVSVFGNRPMAVWGSQAGPRNRGSFESMKKGDDILIVEGDTIRLMGKVASKTMSIALSRELWPPMSGAGDATWELIYFIANPRELNLPFTEFCDLFEYARSYQLRGFTTVAPAKIEAFYQQYDDLYSVLERLQKGLSPVRVDHDREQAALVALPDASQDGAIVLPEPDRDLVSDHARMQWKLARLGIKAGERVWVPAGDQGRIRQTFDFADFDEELASGLDLPHSYVENIDVIWKQEFRIGAAYEIENSTAIYSGLLRFADLNILAPNTLYPMFIVAPSARKNRVREQLRRPTFQKLALHKKVRFLSYETIDDIDRFFEGSASGLSVDLIHGKSEPVA